MTTNTMSANQDLFKKQTVNRPPATSILTSLLSSPKTTCSSPDLTSPSEVFSEYDLGSRSNSPSPQARTPPRKSCVSFAAAQPKSSPVSSRPKPPKSPPLARSPTQRLRTAALQPASNPITGSPSKENQSTSDRRPVLGSVFDEFGDSNASPVFHDYYLSGQPKKLVDDCLKKEMELRIPTISEEGENSFRDDASNSGTDIDDDDDDDDDGEDEEVDEGDNSYEFNDEEETDEDYSEKRHKDDDRAEKPDKATLTGRSHLRNYLEIDISVANCTLSPYNIYTPSRDVVDNFVPGTLDEDQLDTLEAPVSPQSVHDIDPTYPSEDDDDAALQSEQARPVLVSPVRFISRQRGSPPVQSAFSASQARSRGLSRTNSLPWTQKRYVPNQKRPPRINHSDHPRCAAIAIAKSMDHKRHHRREKKEDPSGSNQKKGLGVEAMAAMAKQLTSRNTLGLLAVSV